MFFIHSQEQILVQGVIIARWLIIKALNLLNCSKKNIFKTCSLD